MVLALNLVKRLRNSIRGSRNRDKNRNKAILINNGDINPGRVSDIIKEENGHEAFECIFLNFRDQTKKVPFNEQLETVSEVKNLFYNVFSTYIDLDHLHDPSFKVYVQDQHRHNVFFELEEISDIKPQCLLKLHEQVTPAFASPGALSTNGISQSLAHLDKRKFDERSSCGSEAESEPTYIRKGSVSAQSQYRTMDRPQNHTVQKGSRGTETKPPPAKPNRVFSSSKNRIQDTLDNMPTTRYTSNNRHESSNYLSTDRTSITPSRSGSATPIVDEEARARMLNMEKQLANLSTLVHHALVSPKGVPENFHKLSSRDDVSDCGSVSRCSDMESDRNGYCRTESAINEPSSYAHTAKNNRMSSGSFVTADTRNSLKTLKRRTKEIQVEVKSLKRMVQINSQNARDVLKDAFDRIRVILNTNQHLHNFAVQAQQQNEINRSNLNLPNYLIDEQEKHTTNMTKMEDELGNFERLVDETRDKVVNDGKKLRLEEVERFTEILTNIIRTAADVKAHFPFLQEKVRAAVSIETEKILKNKIKIEPQRLDDALRRCKKLTGTIITMKKLAMVQDAGRNGLSHHKSPSAKTGPEPKVVSTTKLENSPTESQQKQDRGKVLDGLVEELHNVGDISKKSLKTDHENIRPSSDKINAQMKHTNETANSGTIKRSPKSMQLANGVKCSDHMVDSEVSHNYDENMNFVPKRDFLEHIMTKNPKTNFQKQFFGDAVKNSATVRQRATSPKTVLPTNEFSYANVMAERPRSTTPLSSAYHSEWTDSEFYSKPPFDKPAVTSARPPPPTNQNQAASRGPNQKSPSHVTGVNPPLANQSYDPATQNAYLKYCEFRPRPMPPMVQTNAVEHEGCGGGMSHDFTKVASSNESINSQDTMLLACRGKKPPPPPPPRNKQEMLEQRQHELLAKQLRYQLDSRL